MEVFLAKTTGTFSTSYRNAEQTLMLYFVTVRQIQSVVLFSFFFFSSIKIEVYQQ